MIFQSQGILNVICRTFIHETYIHETFMYMAYLWYFYIKICLSFGHK